MSHGQLAMNIQFFKLGHQVADWLETRWVSPAYAGWLLGSLAIFFFGAATNTMAGWLYVISGVSLALLGIAAILPGRSLNSLRVRRFPINPVSVGDFLTIEVQIDNPTPQPKTLLKVQDLIPFVLGKPVSTAIEIIPSQGNYLWTYYLPTQRRGLYRWSEVQLRTASPLGLFWCRRSQQAKATAIVYPTVLPLTTCPLVDQMGQDPSQQLYQGGRSLMATEGLTRTLRPYRYGDPTRLIHWRTSARYGELRVRELEVSMGGQEIIICLDSEAAWQPEKFEQAVVVAASLYFYASKRQLNVKLWTAGTGLVYGCQVVLEALAGVDANEDAVENRPMLPLIWLSQNSASFNDLPSGSRWVFWPRDINPEKVLVKQDFPGLEIHPDRPLQLQLQASLN